MTRAAYPPKYVNVPVDVLLDRSIPAAVRDTYIQIRALAWASGYEKTPPFTFAVLAQMIGKDRSTVYEHVRLLGERSQLLFEDAGNSAYTFLFPSSYSENSYNVEGVSSGSSENSEDAILSTSLNPINTKTKKRTLKSHGSENSDTTLAHPAVIAYRKITHITANTVQRDMITARVPVEDVERWEESLKHWLGHGWSKMNVGGMLDSYGKGGAAGCNTCQRARSNGNGRGTSVPQTRQLQTVSANDAQSLFDDLYGGKK